MKEVRLNGGRGIALVDDDDFERVSQHKWHLHSGNYAATSMKVNGDIKTVSLHRFILRTNGGIDHKDRNGLNNCRNNLRPCTYSQNSANRRLHRNNTSGYKGVSLMRKTGKWSATIKVNRRVHFLGSFECKQEAAKVYDSAARRFFGEFAFLNFPDAHGKD